jgi:hypothetical protein
MFNKNEKEIKELKEKVDKLEERQMDWLIHAEKVLQSVLDNDKRKFMYEIRQEDVEMMKDGEKYRAIRKIII